MSLSDTGGWHWFGTKYGTSLAPESGTPPPGGDTPIEGLQLYQKQRDQRLTKKNLCSVRDAVRR